MSGLGAWIWGTSQVDDAIDRATSELLPVGSEDIALNLEICDQIRSKSVSAKDAMRALKRRLNHKNPNVQLLAFGLTDICIKNGGDLFLAEVTSREFMDNIVSILRVPTLNHDVKSTILRMIQSWSIALEGKPHLGYVGQVYKMLLNEGFKFPPKDPAVASSAMVDTQTAPEWIDSDVCLRCRTPFTFTNRKHHCRNCGQVFDQACSSKSMALPHFGITQEVRVCDGCYNKLTKKTEKVDRAHKHTPSRHKSARELDEAELQRAIELSLHELNANRRPGYAPSQPSPSQWGYSEPPIVDRSNYPPSRRPAIADEEDPDLKAAIEASLREANAPKPSAPLVVETPRAEEPSYSYNSPLIAPPTSQPPLPKIPNYDLEPLETDAILTFNQTVEQVQAQGGRDLSRYAAVNELYEKANGLRPKLALCLDDTGRKEEMLSDMHEKLSQAVKLYDQILSQQVSQPRWRTSHTGPVNLGQYHQPHQHYTTAIAPNGYYQWNPQTSPSQVLYQPNSAHAAKPISNQITQVSPTLQENQLQYVPNPQPQPQQSFHHTHVEYHPSQSTVAPIASAALPPAIQSPTYSQPTYAAMQPVHQSTPIISSPTNTPQSPPPLSHYQAPSTHFSPQQQSAPAGAALVRHNTMAYPSSPPALSPLHMARSNTISSSFSQPHRPPQQAFQNLPAAAMVSPLPPAPATLPQFPSVPTSVPQPTYSIYNSSLPSGFEQKEERKEALLIDL